MKNNELNTGEPRSKYEQHNDSFYEERVNVS